MTERTFSPREFADAVGVSESSVKRWVDTGELHAARTAGGHRRIALTEAVRYIRHRGMSVVDPAALGLADLTFLPPVLATAAVTGELLSRLVHDGQPAQARALVVSAYLRGENLGVLCDSAVREAMHQIGHQWEASPRGIYLEHHATDQFLQAFAHIRTLIPPPAPGAPVAVGGAVAGDPYLIPSLMVSAVLADQGFRTVSLGPDTPASVLVEAAIEQGAALVWLSASIVPDREGLCREVFWLADRLHERGVPLVVGGRALEAEPFGPHPGMRTIPDMQALTTFAGALRERAAA